MMLGLNNWKCVKCICLFNQIFILFFKNKRNFQLWYVSIKLKFICVKKDQMLFFCSSKGGF